MQRVNRTRLWSDAEMSSSYSANQYDSAFRSQRLQNWGETKRPNGKSRPAAQAGHTAFIADDRGHLRPGAVKRGSAWPDFKGTWDLPARIPAHRINPTARSVEGLNRLMSMGFHPLPTGGSQPEPRGGGRDAEAAGEQTNAGEEEEQDGAAPSPVTAAGHTAAAASSPPQRD